MDFETIFVIYAAVAVLVCAATSLVIGVVDGEDAGAFIAGILVGTLWPAIVVGLVLIVQISGIRAVWRSL